MQKFLLYSFASFVLLTFVEEWNPRYIQAQASFDFQSCTGRRCSRPRAPKLPKNSQRELEMRELEDSILFAKTIASSNADRLKLSSEPSLKSLLRSEDFRMEELKKDSQTFFDTLALYRDHLRQNQFFALSRITSKLNAIIGKYWNLSQATAEYETNFTMDFTFPLLLLLISHENRLGPIHDLTAIVHYFQNEAVYQSLSGDHEYVIVLLSSAVKYLSNAAKEE